jgi:hypothetical protein
VTVGAEHCTPFATSQVQAHAAGCATNPAFASRVVPAKLALHIGDGFDPA